MSLVATVYCKCVESGKASTPEFDSNLLTSQPSGRFEFDLPEGHEKQLLKEKKYQWEKSCCTHPWRYYLNEWVSDWRGVKMLKNALTDLGLETFPTLMHSIPLVNAGEVNSEESAKALKELDLFEEKLKQGKYMLASLLADDEELCANSAKHGSCIFFAQDYEYWLDANGLRILSRAKSGDTVFASKHCTQELIQKKGETYTKFTDIANKTSYEVKGDVRLQDARLKEENSAPHTLQVTERACRDYGFDYIIPPLRKAFAASQELGRPVVWA